MNAISVRGLGKKYQVDNKDFWALKDISFDIPQGEVVGIIGRNGSGKSTLLKILSKITPPTEGRAELNGRIKSLLEVGTGFHPDLTGRENIYLSGSIIGMKKKEIDDKFNEIVKFSEIEKFLDTPVKRYSSGMYVRLAFAVAVYMETEILLVDEVLSVGDMAFQKKCIDKMREIAHSGKTILFVSHNMGTIYSLCSRGILLSGGRIIKDGDIREVIAEYQSVTDIMDVSDAERYGNGKCKFTDVEIQSHIQVGDDLSISLKLTAFEDISDANTAIFIYDQVGYRIIDANTSMKDEFIHLKKGDHTITFKLINVLLKPGNYTLGVWIGRSNIEDIDGIDHVKQFCVEGNSHAPNGYYKFPGIYLCEFDYF